MDLRVTGGEALVGRKSRRAPGDAISNRHPAPDLSRTVRAAALVRNSEFALYADWTTKPTERSKPARLL